MRSPYQDAILDLLADGLERTVEEIRRAIEAEPTARIHHVLSELQTQAAYSKELYPIKGRKVRGVIYYRREGIEKKSVDAGTFGAKNRIRFKEKEYPMQIEADIPIPEPGKRSPWPWDKLNVGESFVIEDRSITQVGSLACKASERTGFKFTCRTEGGNVRVWRVA